MLRVNGIAKRYGQRKLFSRVSFTVNAGEKAALIGPNGTGKSTILNIVADRTHASEGSINLAPGTMIAYLRQGFEELTEATVEEAACSVVPGGAEAFSQVRRMETELSLGTESDSLLVEYQSAVDRFQSSGAQRITEQLISTLGLVGLNDVSPDSTISTLSGGQRSRIALAAISAVQPDLLLLDEPTNHLDLPALEWLEEFVQRFSGAALIVSHDRVFLDNTVTRVIEIDTETETVVAHAGNYSDYVAEKGDEEAARMQRWRDQEAEIQRIRADIQRMKSSARSLEGKRRPDDIPAISWNPGSISRGMTKLARSREAKLKRFEESEDRVEKPVRRWQMKLDLETGKRAGDVVVRLNDLSTGYGPTKVLDELTGEVRHGERIALMGPNGTGKSTLLRIIAGMQAADSGSARLGPGISFGYMPQEHTGFNEGDSPLSVIRASQQAESAMNTETDARNFLHFFLFQGDHVFSPVSRLSYGERARLYLAKLVSTKPNLLLLDEPLTHLDVPSRERFEEALLNYSGTTIAATHDRAFVDSWASAIWWLEPGENGAGLNRYMDRLDMEQAAAPNQPEAL